MKTFIVLGMHRSATSLISEGLAKAGVDMGCKAGSNNLGFNPGGLWEDRRFLELHDSILKLAGGSWDNPPVEKLIVEAGEKHWKQLRNLAKQRTAEAIAKKKLLWGWKEPRTTLTIRCWMPYIENPHFITCFRDPMEVAQSLFRRDKIPVKRGLDIAKIYNVRLLRFLQEKI